MRKNARLLTASLAALGLFAAACGGDDGGSTSTEAPASSDAPAADGFIAGIAFDTGGRGDGTFNDSAALGGECAAEATGAEIKELEANVDEDRKANLELLVEGGAKVIVGVGFMFTDPMTEIAAANPDVSFGIVDSVVEADNVSSLVFAEEQGSFLVGAAAALKSESGTIGFIGGQEIDLIKKFEAGYTAGAKYINPDIVVEVAYLQVTTALGATSTAPRKSPPAGTPLVPTSSTPPLAVRVRAPFRPPSRPTRGRSAWTATSTSPPVTPRLRSTSSPRC
jgi:basic membrane protein A